MWCLRLMYLLKIENIFFCPVVQGKKQPEDASSLGKTKTLCEFSQDNFCTKSILKNKNLVP